jgi:HD superfamily phosphohydrolase
MELRVRDPVHNFITLREKQVRLLSTRALQRLRGVRQLALASLVYPGALHTRFDHTLGVTHVAGLMARALGLDADEVEQVELAALLHDIGHGPFSHVSEQALERYAKRDTLSAEQKQKREKIHEIITARMICSDSEIVRLLGLETCENMVRLLSSGRGQPALRSIVSGPLDADKQDYLLRDSYFCGVPYGHFDIHQLHRSLLLAGPEDEKQLMIDQNSIHAVEQFVLAKYYLTKSVYRHKVRLITDQMIVRAIVLGIEKDHNKEMRKLYQFDNTAKFVENFVLWDDARFFDRFGAESQSRCGQMLGRLRDRRLLKRVFDAKLRDLDPRSRETARKLHDPGLNKVRLEIEKEIAMILTQRTGQSVDPDFVICHSFNIKSVREASRNDEAGILVHTKRKPRFFEKESTLFDSINEEKGDQFFLNVYAPVGWETKAEKNRIQRDCGKAIKETIESVCRDAK